jgi:hypothetical protein
MRGYLHLIVDAADFLLEQGEQDLSVYQFNSRLARHTFCRVCGIQPFYTPRSHPTQVDVNVLALDGDVLGRFEVEPFDGKNWEASVDALRERTSEP